MLDEKLISKHSRWDVDMVESWGKEFSSDMMGFPYNIIDRASYAYGIMRALQWVKGEGPSPDSSFGRISFSTESIKDLEEDLNEIKDLAEDLRGEVLSLEDAVHHLQVEKSMLLKQIKSLEKESELLKNNNERMLL